MNATALVNPSAQLADSAAVSRNAREPRPAAGAGEIFSTSLAAQQQAVAASSSKPAEDAPSAPHTVKPGKASKTPKQDEAPVTAVALSQGQAGAPHGPANTEAVDAGELAGSPQAGAMTGARAGQPMPEAGKDLPLSLPPPAADNAGLTTAASGIEMKRAQTSAPISTTPKSTAPKSGAQASLDSATDRPPPKIGDVLTTLLGDVKPQAAPAEPIGSAAVRVAPPTASAPPASDRPSAVTPSAVTATAPETSTQAITDVSFLRVSLSMGGEVVSGAQKTNNPESGPLSSQTASSQTVLSQVGGAHDKAVGGLVLSGLGMRVSEAPQASRKDGAAGDAALQNIAELDRPAALSMAAPGPESAGPTAIIPGGAVPEPRPAAVVSAAQPAISVPLNHESWDRALGQHMLGMLQRDVQQAELHLRPPELGSLEVRIALSQDQASVAFASPHGAVREALEAAVPRLRQMFAETGINLIDVNVSQHSFAQHPQREQGGLAPYATASPAPASLPDAGMPSATTVRSSRLVDYYA